MRCAYPPYDRERRSALNEAHSRYALTSVAPLCPVEPVALARPAAPVARRLPSDSLADALCLSATYVRGMQDLREMSRI